MTAAEAAAVALLIRWVTHHCHVKPIVYSVVAVKQTQGVSQPLYSEIPPFNFIRQMAA